NRVRCSEVWVFSSGGYSERAKEKLLERFKGRSIEFFGSEDIAEFVDDYFPYFWHQLPNDLGSYLQQLGERLHAVDLATSLLISNSNGGMYIELDCYERITKSYFKNSAPKPEIKN